jgi:tRNA-specific 2-thiouridylase
MCNNWLKFGKLWSYGKHLGADYIATGHYARILHADELHTAADPAKDQSYVLFGIRRTVLSRLLFPVGAFRKEEIRDLARRSGLPVFNKPDSQEICFVPGGDHAAFIRGRRPERVTAGPIVDTAGRVLARHDGIERFTIGQRKRLGFAAGQRRFVLRILPEEGTVVVGSREELLQPGLVAADINWLIDPPPGCLSCQVKIRYRSQPAAARVEALSEHKCRVEFETPQAAISPGQAAVFYQGSRVLGGGWIETPMGNGSMQEQGQVREQPCHALSSKPMPS